MVPSSCFVLALASLAAIDGAEAETVELQVLKIANFFASSHLVNVALRETFVPRVADLSESYPVLKVLEPFNNYDHVWGVLDGEPGGEDVRIRGRSGGVGAGVYRIIWWFLVLFSVLLIFGVPVPNVIRHSVPFLASEVAVLILITYVPLLVTLLPSLLG